jgi:hypothetical protein
MSTLEKRAQEVLQNKINSITNTVSIDKRDIQKQEINQAIHFNLQHSYDKQLNEFKTKQRLLDNVISLRRELEKAEDQLQNYLNKKPVVKPEVKETKGLALDSNTGKWVQV